MGIIVETVAAFKKRELPRWFRAIRWDFYRAKFLFNQKIMILGVYLPLFGLYKLSEDNLAMVLAWKKPQSEAELMEIKQNYRYQGYQRDWEIDQYHNDHPPLYDLALRRKKYPEHYGNRYDAFQRN